MADDITSLIIDAFETQKAAGEFDEQLDEFMVNEIVPVWQGYYPVDTGEGQGEVEVTEQASAGKGEVSATSEIANLIEYGSIHNPAFGPRAKTVEHFTK